MPPRLTTMMAALVLFMPAPLFADTIVLYNTGVSAVNNADGTNSHVITTAGQGSVGWTVNGNAALADSADIPSNYGARSTDAGYINDIGNANNNEAPGNYIYATTFIIGSGYDLSTATISGEFSVDNEVTEVDLNGHVVASVSGAGFTIFTPFTILPSADFEIGSNTLTFTVHNDGTTSNPEALEVTELRGSVSPDATPDDVTATPLPESFSAGFILLSGLSAAGLLGRRRWRAA